MQLNDTFACIMMLQVINETLRCGNIVKFLHRKALKDVKYKGKVKWIYLLFCFAVIIFI
jgi:hypothetical protein